MYNYRAFDFANHFCEYAGFDCNWKKHFPSRKHIAMFVNDYISGMNNNSLNNKTTSSNSTLINDILSMYKNFGINLPKSEDCEKKESGDIPSVSNNNDKGLVLDYLLFLEECTNIILVFAGYSHYFWGLWGVVQAKHSPIDFDFLQYAHDRLIEGFNFSMTLLDINPFIKA